MLRTFTIGFPGHGKLDETPHARLIARRFGTEHTELAADPTVVDLVPFLAGEFGEPMVDSSMIPIWLVSHLVRQHCTVALGGMGVMNFSRLRALHPAAVAAAHDKVSPKTCHELHREYRAILSRP